MIGASSLQPGRLEGVRVLALIAACALLIQIVSATLLVSEFETPNASTRLAENLVQHGHYAVSDWTVLRGSAAIGTGDVLRAYHLPGEPLYLAAGFLTAPENARRYLHVPVTVLLVTMIATVAFLIGGRRLAVTTGVLANIDPFVVFHGPVWDDTFLAAALEWTIFSLLAARLAHSRTAPNPSKRHRWMRLMVVLGCAGLAAITRMQAQALLGAVALAILGVPALKPIRAFGWAILVGITVFVGAWGLRNAAELGRFHIGTSHDGITLFRANYATARPTIFRTGRAEGFEPADLAPQYAAAATLGELDADRYFKQQAWAYVRAHPADVALTAALKGVVSVTGLNFARSFWSLRNVVAVGTNVALLVLAAVGMAKWRRQGLGTNELGGFVGILCGVTAAVTLLMLSLGPVGLRYRIDLAGFMYLAAGVALNGACDRRSGGPSGPRSGP